MPPPELVQPAKDLIRLDRVWRSYPRAQVTALRDVSLTLRQREYAAITGPSGSGKSTLLYLSGGMDRPTQGRVFFEGAEPKAPLDWIRLRSRRIGFVFQSFQLVAGLSAAENVELSMFGVIRDESERRSRAGKLLARVGLSGREKHRASELSGGECQRVAIARALANSPDVILADEPTGNLDTRNMEGVLDLFGDLHRHEQVAIVLVTHDARVAERAERVIRLLDGQIVGDQPNEAVA